jgi:hypothetical protein
VRLTGHVVSTDTEEKKATKKKAKGEATGEAAWAAAGNKGKGNGKAAQEDSDDSEEEGDDESDEEGEGAVVAETRVVQDVSFLFSKGFLRSLINNLGARTTLLRDAALHCKNLLLQV